MFTKVSVLIPTRHRLDRLETLLASFYRTHGNHGAELVFRIDDDDTPSIQCLKDYHCVVGPRYMGYGSMSVFFNELAQAATGDVLMCGNDDMVFQTVDWPSHILTAANCYPDGIFNIGVATLNEAHYPFSTVSKLMVKALGFIWDPRIFWGDIFLRDLMSRFDRCLVLPHVQIDHDWAGYRPDRVFMETRPYKEKIEGDQHYWSGPHSAAVADAAAKLAGLVGRPAC